MEVTINIDGQAPSVEATVEVYKYLDRAGHKEENLAHEKRRHWDSREFDEYIVLTEGRFYYLKLKENFYNSETMVILESMQDGLLYSNLLLKMYLMSLKSNGVLLLNDYLSHTVQTIATFTRHQVGTVERALKIFQEFGLVEILTDGAYYMSDIQLLIGQSSSEGERKKKERMRLKRQNLLPSGGTDICPSNGRVDKCPPILEYRDKEIRDKSIENREGDMAHAYGRYRNVFLSSAELAELQTELLTLWEQYIERLSEYMESSGKGYKNHAATIRRWANADKRKEEPPVRNRDYGVEEKPYDRDYRRSPGGH